MLSPKKTLPAMRKIIKNSFLVFLGVLIGFIAYEAIMFIRVSRLRSEIPVTTSLIEARERESQARGQQPKREQVWVSLDRISPNLQRAVLAGEDTNFATHHGFDYQAIQKAWDQALRDSAREAKKEGENDDWLPNLPDFKRGASTISQQLAKNLYLSSQRSFFRKGQEAILTIFLERRLTKRRILELYLNVIEWGDGIYGAEAASQHYFHKPALALNGNEAAFLSAMIPNPRTVFNPQVNPRRVARRQRIIARGMPYVRLP
ncbi:MAG TPA: monofunctional biosynthetic peptidoglycan transglycosylase [Blastocatellia bacterium]|nr:monofunctional biosynthetic peptidoglycan transglycosylase [Blastocatellia bacterium]